MRGQPHRAIVRTRTVALWLAASLVVACGGGSPTGPTSGTSDTGTTGTVTGGTTMVTSTTVTITAAGVSPKETVVPLGARVTFVNSDIRSHEMNSDPHPEHTDCPEINLVGFLSAGQSRETGNFQTARTCGYHDHSQDTNVALQGKITIR